MKQIMNSKALSVIHKGILSSLALFFALNSGTAHAIAGPGCTTVEQVYVGEGGDLCLQKTTVCRAMLIPSQGLTTIQRCALCIDDDSGTYYIPSNGECTTETIPGIHGHPFLPIPGSALRDFQSKSK